MRPFFILFSIFCFSLVLLQFTTIEHMTMSISQKGTLAAFQKDIDRSGVTTSAIQTLQDTADKQTEQITRLEAMVAQLVSK